MNKSLILIAAIGLIAGCTSVPKKDDKDVAAVPTPAAVQPSVAYPDWFVNPPSSEGKIITVGTASSSDLQLAIDLAVVSAKTTLADIIGGKITSRTNTYKNASGSNAVMFEAEKVTKNIIDGVDISGWRPVNSVVNKDGSNYRAYVMIEYIKAADKGKAQKAFESLDDSGKAPVQQISAVKPLDVKNPDYVARRDEVLKRPDAVVIQKIVQ